MKTGSYYSGISVPVYSARSQYKSGLKPSSNPGNISDRDSISGRSKRSRVRKTSNGSIKSFKTMSKKSKNMDFTDYAYREAVSRLKYLLAESYTPVKPFSKTLHDESGDDTDNQSALDRPALSDISKYLSPSSYRGARNITRKHKPFSTVLSKENIQAPTYTTAADYLSTPQPPVQDTVQAPSEIMTFIEKQEDYIEQLEKESKFCRSELSNLLGKVKDVISENEALTEHARSDLAGLECHMISASSESDDNAYEKIHRKNERTPRLHLSGPNIVFESRISELEAELAQANIDLKKLRAENDELKRKIAYGGGSTATADAQRKQIEGLQRDKSTLEDTIRRLEATIDECKAEGRHATTKRQRDMADLAIFEKSQAEMEVKHLREELERQHERVRELQHEMARRVSEERANAERRYNYQVDQLGGDLTNQWEQVARLQMDLERQKRLEADLKRDLSQRNAQIEELKMELKSKRANFLSDIAQVNAEKQSLEQEITSLRLQVDRADRQSKIEAARLNAEISSLRQRLDRADADVLHAKRENLRLIDEVANLEKEVAMGEMKNETRPTRADINKSIIEMQEKHAGTVSELEELIQSQRQLMDKLTNECKTLTNKLEDTTLKHKMEIAALQSNVEFLTNRIISNDRVVKNDSYSNLPTTKAALEYDPPTRPKSSADTEKSRVDKTDVSKSDDKYQGYDYGDDENRKDNFSEGDKRSRREPEPTKQLLPDDTKSYDTQPYNTGGNNEQYAVQNEPNYGNEYQDDYGYEQQEYDGTEYAGDYGQPYEGGDQQYEDYGKGYGQDYDQMYQPDASLYQQQPTVTTTGPSYTNTGPSYSSTGPAYSTSGPSYSSAGPTYTTSGPSYSSASPAYTSSGPAYPAAGVTLPSTGPSYPTGGSTGPTLSSTTLPLTSMGPSIANTGPPIPSAGLPVPAASTPAAAKPTSVTPSAPVTSLSPTAAPKPTGGLPTTEGRPQQRAGSGSMGLPSPGRPGEKGPNIQSQQPSETYKGVSGPAKK